MKCDYKIYYTDFLVIVNYSLLSNVDCTGTSLHTIFICLSHSSYVSAILRKVLLQNIMGPIVYIHSHSRVRHKDNFTLASLSSDSFYTRQKKITLASVESILTVVKTRLNIKENIELLFLAAVFPSS